jgi:hypothetical protein
MERQFVVTFNGTKFWVKLRHAGSTLTATLMNINNGELYQGTSNQCGEGIYRQMRARSSSITAGNTPNQLLFHGASLHNTSCTKDSQTNLVFNRCDYLIWKTDRVLSGVSKDFHHENDKQFWIEVSFPANYFQEAPIVVTSLCGKKRHWNVIGATSLYKVTKDGFFVWVESTSNVNAQTAINEEHKWYLSWTATSRDFE